MFTETVTLVEHKTFSGTSQYGPWTKSVFVDAQGREFAVFTNKQAGAALASQLMPFVGNGQTVAVTFEVKQRGDYTDYNLKAVGAAGAAPAAAPVQTTASPAAPPPQQQTIGQQEKEERIGRYAAYERAVITFGAAGRNPLENFAELLDLSEQIKAYCEGGIAAVSVLAEEEPVVVEAEAVAGPVD